MRKKQAKARTVPPKRKPAPAIRKEKPRRSSEVVVVDRDNFAALLPEVLEAIDAASFVCLDAEFTGLAMSRAQRNSILDDAQERYAKIRDAATNFGLLQFGISAFIWDSSKEKFRPQSYSFYVYPAPRTSSANNERRISMQLSSVTFLVDNGFDFNASFRKGIPFLSHEDEAVRREQRAANADRSMVAFRGDDAVFVEEQCRAVAEWISLGKEEEQLVLPACNSFQRLVLYQQLHARIPGILLSTTKSAGNKGSITVRRAASTDARADEAAEFEASLAESVGFRRVIDRLASVPAVVGHNCMMDLCHVHQKFLGSLPVQLADFKRAFSSKSPEDEKDKDEVRRGLFGPVVDTKYLAKVWSGRDPAFTAGSLEEMTAWVQREMVPTGRLCVSLSPAGVLAESKFHDAGFDALCTGILFVSLSFLLASDAASPLERVQRTVADHGNRMYMMQSDFDCIRMDLLGEDAPPDRSRVLYIGRHPQSAELQFRLPTTSTVQEVYAACLPGTPSPPAHILWSHDGTSMFVVVEDEDLVPRLLKSPFAERIVEAAMPNAPADDLTAGQRELVVLPYAEYRKLAKQETAGDAPRRPSIVEPTAVKRRLVSYAD